MKRKFSTHHAQQKPCAYATLSITTQLFGAVLFIWDIVSDILVITQLAAAGAFGPMSLGIIFMSVAAMKRQPLLRPPAPHLLHCKLCAGCCPTSFLVSSSVARLRLHGALRARVCTSLVLCGYLCKVNLHPFLASSARQSCRVVVLRRIFPHSSCRRFCTNYLFSSGYAIQDPLTFRTSLPQGTIVGTALDLASVVFPGGAYYDYTVLHRYPGLRKVLRSVFESAPQSILQLYIVASGILEDSLPLVVVSMLTSLFSAVLNIYLTYSASLAVEDQTFLQYVVSLVLSITGANSVFSSSGELRDGMKRDALWRRSDVEYHKGLTLARPVAVKGHKETEKMRGQGVCVEEVDELPAGLPLRVETLPAWAGWWTAQLISIDRLRSFSLPLAFLSARAAHRLGQCIANSQYLRSASMTHCYVCPSGAELLARGLACASSLERFETIVDFSVFIAQYQPGPLLQGDNDNREFWEDVQRAVLRKRMKEDRVHRASKQDGATNLSADESDRIKKHVVKETVVFSGMAPLSCVLVQAGRSATSLFNETVANSAEREAVHQANLEAQRKTEEAAKRAASVPNAASPTTPTRFLLSPKPAAACVELEDGGTIKGLHGTSERARPLTFMGITSPGIDLLPPTSRELVLRFEAVTRLRGGVCLDQYASICTAAELDGERVIEAGTRACSSMLESIVGWVELSRVYHPTEHCRCRMQVCGVQPSMLALFRRLVDGMKPELEARRIDVSLYDGCVEDAQGISLLASAKAGSGAGLPAPQATPYAHSALGGAQQAGILAQSQLAGGAKCADVALTGPLASTGSHRGVGEQQMRGGAAGSGRSLSVEMV